MTGQKETIKQVLDDGQYHCGTEFQKIYIPEYRTRINELRKQGYLIEKRRCQQHKHKGIMQEWKIASANTAEPKKQESCCFSVIAFGEHERSCPSLVAAKPTLF